MMSGLVLALLLTADDGGAAPASSAFRPNLLRGADVKRADGAPMAAQLADGVASTDGDVWDNPRAAILKAGGTIEWQLDAVEPIGALRIQADNNDRYLVSGSVDGANWYVIWIAQPVDLPGVQTRTSPELRAQARFLRLTAEGGDSMYSITELEAFDSMAALQAAQLARIAPPPPPPPPPAPPFDTGFLVVLSVTGAAVYYFVWAKRRASAPSEPPPAS
ncbi:MAG: hypothetical protein ACOZQL_30200 [Myxococcota bacterium]